jgi:hypothetical protein
MLESMLRFGKSQQFSILYTYPYLDKKKRLGVGAEIGYRNNREVGFITRNDKLVYLFQSKGLSTEKYSSVQFTYRRNIFVTHQLIAGYRSFSFDSILADSNDQYSYEGELHPGFLNIYYKLKIDYRDLKYYPLTGWYADVEINKSGFGFEGPVNIGWGKTTLRHFSRLASRWYSGISFIGKLSMAKWQPYFLIQGLGYQRDFVRGYEYNVVDGRHYTLLHSTVKYALLPQQSRDIGFVKTSKFGKIHYATYLTAFADAGYVWQPQWNDLYNNKLPETLLASAGLGVDFVTYYDKVIRVEYSVNRSGKSGIFINFIAGI